MFDRRSNVEAPHGKTCQWILTCHEYEQWRSQPSGLLWIKGKPGSGKSTLMSFLYKHICSNRHDDNVYLDFFFNARGSELQRTPVGMLRSLLNQILRQKPSLWHLTQTIYEEKNAAFGRDHDKWKWQKPELEILLANAVITCSNSQAVEIFIDALDEAGERSAREMARYLHAMNDRSYASSSAIKICISCRHYPVVSQVSGAELCVEEHNENDISTFIHDRLNVYEHHMSEKPIFYTLIQELVGKARGVFQWINLVVPMIEKSIDDGLSLSIIQSELQKVPRELSDVYQYILNNIIDKRYRTVSLHLFQWVCLAKEPLSVVQLQHALGAQNRARKGNYYKREIDAVCSMSPRTIRSYSGGLLEVVPSLYPESEIVQVIHQSVRDFLLSHGLMLLTELANCQYMSYNNSEASSFHDSARSCTTIQRCHGVMYQACLNYLIIGQFNKILPEKAVRRASVLTYRRKRTPDNPLFNYVSEFVFIHAEEAKQFRGMSMRDEVQLLNIAADHWKYGLNDDSNFSDFDRFPRSGIASGRILHMATTMNSIELIEYLIHGGVDVDEVDRTGYAAIHIAAANGSLPCIKSLAAAGAKIDVPSRDGRWTPLSLAASRGHYEVLEWLLEQGCPVNMNTGSEQTFQEEFVTRSALCAAAANGSLLIVKILIDAGADINVLDSAFGSALDSASSGGHEAVVRLLLERGADPNDPIPALRKASSYGLLPIVKLLIEHGAKVNVPTGYQSAISMAAEEGYASIVRLLIEAGANLNDLFDGRHSSALELASRKRHEAVVSMLREAGAKLWSERTTQQQGIV